MEPTASEEVERLRILLANYVTQPDAVTLVQKTKFLLLVGITAAGKDTIKQQLLQKPNYYHLISHTTRPPRENHGLLERDGIAYHFINPVEAERMIENHEFIEAKLFSGNLYGTSVAEVKRAYDEDKIAVTDIEVQGVAEYKLISPYIPAVFLLPPNFETWRERLRKRYGEKGIDMHDLHKRMVTAEVELRTALSSPDFIFVINDTIDSTVSKVSAVAHGLSTTTASEERAHQLAHELMYHIKKAI